MSRTLFVHIGPRKTATSAVQSFLRDHPNTAVVYPKVGLFADGAHHKLVYKFFGEQRRAVRDLSGFTIESLFGQIAELSADKRQNILISSELLSDESRDVGKFVRSLLPYLGLTLRDVRIVLVCREHFARAASWYNMHMRAPKRRQAHNHQSPDEFLDLHAHEVCYEPLVRRVKNTGLLLVAIDFQPAETIARRFLHTIGIPEAELPHEIERKRAGLSAKVLIATIATNCVTRSVRQRQSCLNAFATMSGAHQPAGFIFGRKAAEQADRLFAKDRSFLLDEFGLNVSAPDRTFESTLILSRSELDEIERIAAQFGRTGAKIIELASQYLRE